MEAVFLDVGQATSQVVLLGDQAAIVIDAGLKGDRTLLRFLKNAGIDRIACLAISHSDQDHMGGAIGVLNAYQGRIDTVGFVDDGQIANTKFWLRVREQVRDGDLSIAQLARIERREERTKLWEDDTKSATLITASPTSFENIESTSTNATSAVLFFETPEGRILFTADSSIEQWKEIHRRVGRRVGCDIIAVPHHGGDTGASDDELAWLFKEAIFAKNAVISVGTSNNHGHPFDKVIAALRTNGARVLCTQITGKCCDKLEALRPGVIPPLQTGRSRAKPDINPNGKSRNVACAGTVVAKHSAMGWIIDRQAEHERAVSNLARVQTPLCVRK